MPPIAVCHSATILWCVQMSVNLPKCLFSCCCSHAYLHPSCVCAFVDIQQNTDVFLFGFSGEGFHNYHHTFPFDYATSEFGCKLNLTTAFIDTMCYLGLAKDPKRVSKEMILARMQRTGDSSNKSGWVTPATNSTIDTNMSNQDRT